MPIISEHSADKRIGRLWRKGRIRRLVSYALFVMFIIITVAALGEEIGHHISVLEMRISDIGFLGVLVYIALFAVLTSAFLPDTVMGIIAGALFGLTLGIIAVFSGALIGSAFQYWLARRIIKGTIERKVASRPNLASIQKAVSRQGVRLQFLIRMTPISPVVTSYLLGASGVRFSTFMIACGGLLPTLFLEVYSGYAGRHIAGMAGRSEFNVLLHDIMVLGGLISAVIVLFLISRAARHAVETSA